LIDLFGLAWLDFSGLGSLNFTFSKLNCLINHFVLLLLLLYVVVVVVVVLVVVIIDTTLKRFLDNRVLS
jgi:uncharacterized Tic20 family protein